MNVLQKMPTKAALKSVCSSLRVKNFKGKKVLVHTFL